jgi:predicted TIM-barrel enzyme
MFFILFVLQDTDKLDQILDAWQKAGVSGVTILPSIGIVKMKEKRALQEDFPIIPTLEDLVESPQNHSRSLFSIVQTQEIVDAVYKATIDIVGLLTNQIRGFL